MSFTVAVIPGTDVLGVRGRFARAALVVVGTALVVPRVPRRVRRVKHVGLALVAAVGMYAGAPDLRMAPSRRVALAGGVGLLAGGSSAMGAALGAAAERALAARGVLHPRWWIGLGAVALVEATELGRRVSRPAP